MLAVNVEQQLAQRFEREEDYGDLYTAEEIDQFGAELIDRFWDGLVRWATVDQPAIAAANATSMTRATVALPTRVRLRRANIRIW